ncbi:MAG: hypothetical protein NTW52_09615 [Planctomycetota bacterium]|nr:hypothetical protein [Planctomycetota bacterium]
MEPVRIRCQQCQGKLVIRTPELLGKSVVCPRCQSVIQVPLASAEPSPSAWASGNNSILPPSFDSTAVTKVQDAITPQRHESNKSKDSAPSKASDKASGNDSIPLLQPSQSSPPHEGVGFLDWEDLPDELLIAPVLEDLPYGDPTIDIGAHPLGHRATDALGNVIQDGLTQSRPLQSSSDWVSPSTARTRVILLVATTALTASIAAIVLFMMFLSSFTSTKPDNALNPAPVPVAVPESGDNAVNVAANEVANKVAVPLEIDGKLADRKLENADANESTMNGLANDPNAKPSVAPESIAGAPPTPSPTEPSIPDTVAPDLKLGMSAQNRTAAAEPAKSPVEEVNMVPPAGLAQFAPVFELGSTGFSSDAATLEPATPEFTGGGGVVDIGLLTHPAAIVPEPWDSVKTTPVLKLRVDQKPLSQVLLLLGQLSNSGFGWDIELLHFSSVDPTQKVDVDATNSTVEAELTNLSKQVPFVKQVVAPKEVLNNDEDKAKINLQEAVPIEQIQLLPLSNQISEQLPSDWSLDDLLSSDESQSKERITQWNRLLRTIFPTEDESWVLEGRSIQWSDQAPLTQRSEMAVFLDQSREIYSLPAKSGFFTNPSGSSGGNENRLAWTQPVKAYDEAYQRLQKTGRSVFSEVTSSPSLLESAARECELELLFDWPSLQSHGFSPASSSLSIFKNRTWPQIAKRIMDQFDLVAVVDGPKRLILTTLAQQRRWPRATILQVRPGESIESIGESFRMLSPTDAKGLSILSVTPLPKNDPTDAADFVVVRHCPPNTKQLELLEVRRALHITSEDR